jgi:hypothetical protein
MIDASQISSTAFGKTARPHKSCASEARSSSPRLAQREPRSLAPEQLGQLPMSIAAVPQPVHAWILWEDGVEELVQAHAIAWTKRAVRVRFGAPPHLHEVWVWAGAVERA